MSGRSPSAIQRRCARCIYLLSPVRVHALRDMMEPHLILPLCLNHAQSPGEVREVHPCECCRNFEARPEPSRGTAPPPGPEVKYIPLGHHQFAIVDAADFEWLNRYTWRLLGGEGVLGYAYRFERGKRIFMHREIMQTPPGMVTDHKDRNPIHNRRCNLRNCTPQENQRNRRRVRNQSGFVGVYPHGKRWRAEVRRGGKVVYREVFDDKVEAAKARDRKAYQLYGPFAYLNFPDEIRSGETCPCPGRCDLCPLVEGSTSILPAPLVGPESLRREAGPRYVDLSGSAHAHCFAYATLTVIHAGTG